MSFMCLPKLITCISLSLKQCFHLCIFAMREKHLFTYLWCILLHVLSKILLKAYFCFSKVEYHPFQRPQELVNYCKSREIVFEGYCPLAKGQALTHPSIIRLAKKYGRTPAQICIRWSIQVMQGANENTSPLSQIVWILGSTPEFTQSIFSVLMIACREW